MNEEVKDYPLNTIFYGPPGTGKTYTTIKRAAEIIKGEKIEKYKEAQDIFKANLGDRIEFVTFHQNFSYEDFVQGIKPKIEDNDQLCFELKNGVFYEICDRAKENGKNEEPEGKQQLSKNVIDKKLERIYQRYLGSLKEDETEFVTKRGFVWKFLKKGEDDRIFVSKPKAKENPYIYKQYLFELFNDRPNAEYKSVKEVDSFLKENLNNSGYSTYYWAVHKHFRQFVEDNNEISNGTPVPAAEEEAENGNQGRKTDDDEASKNYVIIIDEINRANISRVFGELITLIEPDKRLGNKHELRCTLPSGEEFGVPPNLYIIGTMNTADKSIALVDVALRRRFVFEAMYPNPELVLDNDANKIMKSINESIIKEKGDDGYDFQIGHSYFMRDEDQKDENGEVKKVEGDELIKRLNERVIPLLMEYFMNDKKTVSDIIKKSLDNTNLSVDDSKLPIEIGEKGQVVVEDDQA